MTSGICLRVTLTVTLCMSATRAGAETVTAYVALDEMYSRPILDSFEQKTGMQVWAVYDTEASKTTGLVNRIMAERARPRCDVFWNNEVVQTIVLKNKGLLEAYKSPAAGAIPGAFKDAEGYWTGFAARARVIIYNTKLVTEPPTSILDLAKPEWAGKAAIALPLFGTTATQAAALFARWGDERARSFFRSIHGNRIAVLPGNATVRDMVARGEYAWGLTDTDDANGGVEDGFPVKWLLPDQAEGGLGTLVIPNTVALISGGPNTTGGKALIDFLLSAEVEGRLAQMRSIQIPLNPSVKAPERVPALTIIRTTPVSFEAAAAAMSTSAAFMREEFQH